MDVSVIVSKKTLNQLDQFLNYHHNLFVRELEATHQVSLESYLKINIKKETKKKRNVKKSVCSECPCMARIWNKGYGGQCRKLSQQGHEYCSIHLRHFQNGHLPHGRIDMPCPKILPKLDIQPFSPTKRIIIKKKS